MTDEGKKSMWHHIVAAGRDILVVSAVLTLMSGIAVTITKPFWKPFADVPAKLQELRLTQQELKATLSKAIRPEIVEFRGKSQIVGNKKVRAGGTMTILYFLRRNASCKTQVERRFYDVDRGVHISGPTLEAQQAPVTENFIPFKLDIDIPIFLRPGKYIYTPTLLPIDCGIYTRMTVLPSEIFEVINGE